MFVTEVSCRYYSEKDNIFLKIMKYLSLLVTSVAILRSVTNAEPEVNLVNVVITGDDVKDAYAYAKEKVPEKARGVKNTFRKKLLVHLGAVEADQLAQTVPGPVLAKASANDVSSDSESELDSDDEYAGRYNSRRIKAGLSPYARTDEYEDSEIDHSI